MSHKEISAICVKKLKKECSCILDNFSIPIKNESINIHAFYDVERIKIKIIFSIN